MAMKVKSVLDAEKEVLGLRMALDDSESRYRFNDNVRNSFATNYLYSPRMEREYSVHSGEVCTIADCYILYILGHFGVADIYTVRRALANIKRGVGKSLLIPNTDAAHIDHFRARIGAMAKRGFIGVLHYNLYGGSFEEAAYERAAAGAENLSIKPIGGKKGVGNGSFLVTLYTVDHEAYNIMNSKLHKSVATKEWLNEKGDYALIGIASSAHTASYLMASPNFRSLGNTFFRTPEIGAAHVDGELIFENSKGVRTSVGMVSAYLHRDDRIMTEEDYKNERIYKLNLIRNYLFKRSYNANAAVIVTVENHKELLHMARDISRVEGLSKYQDRIFFAGEGAVKAVDGDMSKALLRVVPSDEEELGFDFVNTTAEFLM